MSRTLIRSGLIVSDGRSFRGDILLEGEKIIAVEERIEPFAALEQLIDASDCEVFPGGVDPHVHMELQTRAGRSSDDFETGSRAALAGGTTTIIDFVTPGRNESLLAALSDRKRTAGKALCDYAFHMSVTSWNEGIETELEACAREGLRSVKTYMAYKETIGLNDDELLAVFDAARKAKLLVMVHAESGDMVSYLQKKLLGLGRSSAEHHPDARPPELEGDAVNRALLMARFTGAALYIVHLSSRQGVQAIFEARKAGQTVIGETCPQYLLLDESRYREKDWRKAASFVMSPPLRNLEHQEALWEALEKGVIQTLATDHCPFRMAQKIKFARSDFTRIPNGCGGVEFRLPLLYTYGVKSGRIPLPRFVDLVSTRPAKIFGLYPRKGSIRVGSDADLVIWDPFQSRKIKASEQWHNSDHTVYEGLELQGGPVHVFSRGSAVFSEGKMNCEPKRGRYLHANS